MKLVRLADGFEHEKWIYIYLLLDILCESGFNVSFPSGGKFSILQNIYISVGN